MNGFKLVSHSRLGINNHVTHLNTYVQKHQPQHLSYFLIASINCTANFHLVSNLIHKFWSYYMSMRFAGMQVEVLVRIMAHIFHYFFILLSLQFIWHIFGRLGTRTTSNQITYKNDELMVLLESARCAEITVESNV